MSIRSKIQDTKDSTTVAPFGQMKIEIPNDKVDLFFHKKQFQIHYSNFNSTYMFSPK